MQFPPNQSPTTPPDPPTVRRPRRSFVLGVLLAASLAASLTVSAYEASKSVTTLNTEKVERAIEQSSLAQRGQHVQASCPSGVHQKKGMKFSCIAVVGNVSTRFVVTELDGSGRVHYEAR